MYILAGIPENPYGPGAQFHVADYSEWKNNRRATPICIIPTASHTSPMLYG